MASPSNSEDEASPFSDGFFAKNPSAKDFDLVISKYKNNVLDHILEHYEMNVRTVSGDSTDNQPVTLPRLLYYHVYGDYVLDYKDKSAVYNIRQIPSTVNVPLITNFSQMGNNYPFEDYMRLSDDGVLTGIFSQIAVKEADTGLRVKVENKTGKVNWINQDMGNQGIGTRFLLPSIGTQIVKLHELGNQSDYLRDAFANELIACAGAFKDMSDNSRLSPFTRHAQDDKVSEFGEFTEAYEIFDKYFNDIRSGDIKNFNVDISPVLAVLCGMLVQNPDYQKLWTEYESTHGAGQKGAPPLPSPDLIQKKVRGADKGIYHTSNNFETYSACKNLASFLFKIGTQTFSIGDVVYINTDRLINAIESPFDRNRTMPEDTEYTDSTKDPDTYSPYQKPSDSGTTIKILDVNPPEGVSGQFAISIDGIPWAEEWIDNGVPQGVPDNQKLRWVAASDLSLRVTFEKEDDEDPDSDYTVDFQHYTGDVRKTTTPKKKGQKRKKGKGKAIIQPRTIVFQRILFDTLATLQMMLAVGEKYDYSNADQQFREELKMRYLSSGMNARRGNRAIREQYPNIMPPTARANAPTIDELLKKKGKRGGKATKGMLDYLTACRAYYTLSVLTTQRAKVQYKDSMDALYGESILLQEIGWLSTLIGDSAKFAIREREPWKDDYTAQLQYDEVPGKIKSKRQMAYMPKRTVFYQIESPILKEVIADYLSVYNQMTLGAAFDIDKGGVKERELANAIWGSVRTRTSGLFDTVGLRGHEFFASLFSNVNDRLERSSILKSHYPPSWLGDNTIQKLQTDPNTIGVVVEDGYYQQKLIEYIDHLGNVYKGNYAVPLQIITEVEKTKIRYSRDPISLKEEFFNRIKNDNSKKKLKTTWFLFKPYSTVISIIRAHLDIPFHERETFVAESLNQEQADQIKDRVQDTDKRPSLIPIVPTSHPLHGVDN